MKKQIHLFFCTALLCLMFNPAQATGWQPSSEKEFRSAYEKALAWFTNNTNYKVNVQHLSFSNHISPVPYDKSDGFYKRSTNNFYSSAMGINTIQNDKMKIVVDTTGKLIIITDKIKEVKTVADPKEFTEMMRSVKTIKKQPTASGEQVYRLEFNPGGAYTAYEFTVDAKGLLAKMCYYFAQEVQADEEDPKSLKGKPRIEIRFSNYQTGQNFSYEKDFSESNYFRKEGKKLILNPSYKDFELKDYRFAEKK